MSCQLTYAAVLVLTALSRDYLLCFAAMVGLGFFDALATVTRHNVMQLAAPGRIRGRVMANMGTVTRGTTPLSQTQRGLLAGILGAPLAIVASAVALSLAATSAGYLNRALWQSRRQGLVREPKPPIDAVDPGGSTA